VTRAIAANAGDLVRYAHGPTALMRVTDIIGGRYYGRAFHSRGTCTSRSEVFEPSADDRDLWARSHDSADQWIRGAWGSTSPNWRCVECKRIIAADEPEACPDCHCRTLVAIVDAKAKA
jgi:DNA-directed RNA polymerase subunit RPC12/RpoP